MKIPLPGRFLALLGIVAAFAPLPPASAQTNPPLQWRPLHEPGVGGWVTSLSVCPSNPNLILAGGDILGIARSVNGGATWTRPATPTGSYMIEEFTWHPKSGDSSSPHYGEVWVGTMAGPWKSTDFGQTWAKKRTGMPQPTGGNGDFRPAIQKILVDPTVPASGPYRLLAFFGTHRLEKPGGFFNSSGAVYVSTDGGENWSLLGQTVPTTVTDSKARLVNTAAYKGNGTDADKIIYAATARGFYKSIDDGLTWVQKSVGLPAADKNIRALAVHPTNGQILWVTVSSGGVYKSTDGGENWAAANTGLTNPTSGNFDAIAVSPANPNLLFTAKINDKKLYRSTDGGATWVGQPGPALGSSPNPVYRDFYTLIAHPTQAGVFFGGTPTDIWKTTNAAAPDDLSSTDDLDGIPGPDPYSGPFWTNISSVPRNGGWAGTGYSGLVASQFRWNPYNANEAALTSMDNGKFVSRDGLQSWKFAGGGTGKGINDWFAWRDFSFSGTAGHWYASSGQGSTDVNLYRTTTAGSAWSVVSKPSVGGVTATGNPDVVHAHRTNSARVWVVWGGKLYYSASGGSSGSWTLQANDSVIYGSVSDLAADPADTTGETLWIGASKGLFRSIDGGLNWSKVGASGSPQNLSRVRLDPTNPLRVWIVNAYNESTNTWDTGLWRLVFNASTLTGTWSKLATWGDPGSPVKRIVDVGVDPTNGNRIVATTSQDNFTAETWETGVWVNDNNGASNAWRREVNGLGVQRARTVAFRPGTSEVVVGTMGGGYFIADTDGSVIDLAPAPAASDLGATTDGEAQRTSAGDGGGTVGALTATELWVGNANNGGSAYSPVYAFQLPSVGSVANPFTTATFTVGLSTSTSTFSGQNLDVYGLTARTASTILAADAFCGANDTTDATKIQDNWINTNVSPAVATGPRTVSNAALVAYLNAQYAGGAGAGKFVFLRISPDALGNSWKNVRFAASEYTANPAWKPRLVIE